MYVAEDHQQGALVLRAADEAAVWRHLKTLPLFEYLKFEVTPLGI